MSIGRGAHPVVICLTARIIFGRLGDIACLLRALALRGRKLVFRHIVRVNLSKVFGGILRVPAARLVGTQPAFVYTLGHNAEA